MHPARSCSSAVCALLSARRARRGRQQARRRDRHDAGGAGCDGPQARQAYHRQPAGAARRGGSACMCCLSRSRVRVRNKAAPYGACVVQREGANCMRRMRRRTVRLKGNGLSVTALAALVTHRAPRAERRALQGAQAAPHCRAGARQAAARRGAGRVPAPECGAAARQRRAAPPPGRAGRAAARRAGPAGRWRAPALLVQSWATGARASVQGCLHACGGAARHCCSTSFCCALAHRASWVPV